MIRAIDTEYKGYRFRSRLEARWAVFFDAMGIEYVYEPEGYTDGQVKYLPDFLVKRDMGKGFESATGDTFIEIKPNIEEIVFSNIYLAGKIFPHYASDDWRDDLFESLMNKYQQFNIVGPEPTSHDDNSDLIVERCLAEIDSSDIVFANIDTLDTVGTFIELGYAKAAGKKIFTYFQTEELANNAWFAAAISDKYIVGGDPTDLLKDNLSPITKEFEKARMITKGFRHIDRTLVMLKGDPIDCSIITFSGGEEHNWGNNLPRVLRLFMSAKSTSLVPEAAKKARSKRFEFGDKE